MATNIIERMFVELGLDFSKYAVDADKAEKLNKKLEKALHGVEGASKKVEKAHANLTKGQKAAIKEAADLGKAIAGATKAVTGLFSAILVSTGLGKLVNDVARANNELYFLEKNLGMNARSIRAWQGVAEASGGTAAGMTASMMGLKQSMNALVMFGDASMLPYFNALGVSIVDDSGKVRDMNDVMLDLADAFQKMPRDQAYTLAKRMGLDDGTINTLTQGRKELQAMLEIQRQMYRSDEKELAVSREMAKQRAILNAQWESMKTMIGNALMPVIVKLLNLVNDFMMFLQKHQNTVKHVFEGAAIVLTVLLIPALKAALGALLALLAPIAPVALAVTVLGAAFIALYDDYKTWAEGGKSLFDWSWLQRMIDSNVFSIDNLKQAFKGLVNEVLNSVLPAFKDALNIFDKISKGDIKGAWASLVSMTSRPVEGALNAIQYAEEGAAKVADIALGNDPKDPSSLSGQRAKDPRLGTTFRNKVVDTLGLGDKSMVEDASRKRGERSNVSNQAEKMLKSESKNFASALSGAMEQYGITGEKDKAAFLANVDHESNGGKRLTENMNYKDFTRWAGINKNTRKWAATHTAADFAKLSPAEKANIMYAGMNGNVNSGDGYKFRGRGGIQLTGRANYQAFANYSGRQDIMDNPDLLATDMELAAQASAWFWKNNSKASAYAEAGNFAAARKAVNGGTIGLEDSTRKYRKYLAGNGELSGRENIILANAVQAQDMAKQSQIAQLGAGNVTNNDNKTVSVTLNGGVHVSSSANTIDGTVNDGFNAVNNRTGQLMTGLT